LGDSGDTSASNGHAASLEDISASSDAVRSAFYDRAVSFFDHISCESLDRQAAASNNNSAILTTTTAKGPENVIAEAATLEKRGDASATSDQQNQSSTVPKHSDDDNHVGGGGGSGSNAAATLAPRMTQSSRLNPREAWRQERELNQLTFGMAALAPRNRGGYNR